MKEFKYTYIVKNGDVWCHPYKDEYYLVFAIEWIEGRDLPLVMMNIYKDEDCTMITDKAIGVYAIELFKEYSYLYNMNGEN